MLCFNKRKIQINTTLHKMSYQFTSILENYSITIHFKTDAITKNYKKIHLNAKDAFLNPKFNFDQDKIFKCLN